MNGPTNSSGLVAVAWVPDDVIAKLRSGEPKIVLTGVPMLKYEGVNTSAIVLLSDAEAIIAAKDAEIERLAKESAGYAGSLRGKHSITGATYQHLQTTISKQAERIKELEAERGESQYCAGCNEAAKTIENQSAALKLARGLLDRIAECELGWAAGLALDAIAAIDALGE